jgi:hypothetical protein
MAGARVLWCTTSTQYYFATLYGVASQSKALCRTKQPSLHPPAPPNIRALPRVNTSSAVARLGLREAAMRSRKPAAAAAVAAAAVSGG